MMALNREGKFTLDIWKKFFTVKVVRHRLSREVMDAPFAVSAQGQVGWGSEKPGLVRGSLTTAEGIS